MSHYLNAKNFVQVALSSGKFSARQPAGSFANSTRSFGIDAAYNLVLTPTLSATARAGVNRSSVDVSGLQFDPLTGALCFPGSLCTDSTEARNFTGTISLRQRSERTTLNFDVSRALAPRSNGTQVVQDDFRVYVSRTLTGRLSASAGAIYSTASEIGRVGRLDQTYGTVDTSLSYQLTPTLTTYGRYSYVSSRDGGSDAPTDTNNRLFFGVSYRGVGFRR
jgi:predicted porin